MWPRCFQGRDRRTKLSGLWRASFGGISHGERRRDKAHNQEVPRESSAREKIMKRQYPVRIDKEVDSDWGASVPDLPGCVATGKTIDTALRRIEGAIELHVRGLREDGIRIPPPRQRAVRPRRTAKHVNFHATVAVAARPGARSDRRWSGAD